jgi:excisionase family DNA binding protein
MIGQIEQRGPAEQLLFTVEDAARQWRCSRTSVYAALAKNLIKSVTFGRSRRIHRDEVERVAREGLGDAR